MRNCVLMGQPEPLQTDWHLKYWRPPDEAFKMESVYAEFKRWHALAEDDR